MTKLIHVIPEKDHQLTLHFEDGSCGSINMKPYLEFGIFSRLQDPDAFKQVRVSFDTVEWASGPDLDPEWVRDHLQMEASPQSA